MTQPSPTPKGEETSPSPWTENVTQHSPDKPKAATSEWYIQRGQHRSGLPWYFEGPILYKVLERNYKIDWENFTTPRGGFLRVKQGETLAIFFFDPFFRYLGFLRPTPRKRNESRSDISRRLRSGPPRRKRNAAWRLCLAKNSVRKIFAAQVGESKSRRQAANPTNLPQLWASRVAIKTLRSANASPNFSFPKVSRRNLGGRRFQRPTLEEEGSNSKPRMKPT